MTQSFDSNESKSASTEEEKSSTSSDNSYKRSLRNLKKFNQELNYKHRVDKSIIRMFFHNKVQDELKLIQ